MLVRIAGYSDCLDGEPFLVTFRWLYFRNRLNQEYILTSAFTEVSRRSFWSLDSIGFLILELCVLREKRIKWVLSYIIFNK